MKRKILLLACLLFPGMLLAQAGYDKNYHSLTSGNITADKNFYLITAIDQSPEVKKAIISNNELAAIYKTRRDAIHKIATAKDAHPYVDTVFTKFTWDVEQDSISIDHAIRGLYKAHPAPFDELINKQLRPSGYYQRFITLDNIDFFLKAWSQYFRGVNYIISQYGLGWKLRYPNIDSASYNVHSKLYSQIIDPMFNLLDEQEMTTFYEPSLKIAMQLMDANDRDEPSRFEPLEAGENKAAAAQVKKTDWSKYLYTAMMVPGAGPDIYNVPLSYGGKIRCTLVAERFKKGMAPFIIVSGGYCHPFHTPYCEAIEMKKYLITKFAIPESAIIIEPQARHTTTNFRNADRLMIRYGIPTNKKALCVTASDQADYIMNKGFDNRNMKELGYLPYTEKTAVSVHDISYYPVMESLHADPLDPLDP